MRQEAPTDNLDPTYLANLSRIRSAPFFREALSRAEKCSQILAELGQPIEADLPKGSIKSLCKGSAVEIAVAQKYLTTLLDMMMIDVNRIGHADEFAHISIALRGPNGQGKLTLLASCSRGAWTFHSLDVLIETRKERISLMPTAT